MLKTSTICDKIHDFNQVDNRPCKKKTIKQEAINLSEKETDKEQG